MSARPPLTTQAIESGIRDLPPLPAVVAEIIASTRNEQLDVQDLATKISHDVALSARTLKLANSPFYGVTRQVDSISDAAVILGMRTIRSVAVGAGLVTRLRTGQCVGFDYTIFWRHSIAAALVAQSMASAAQCDGDTAFLLGLLHDLGRVGLATAFGEDYAEALRVQRQRDCLLIEAERATLGVDHMQVGGLIAEHWKFAPHMVQAIAHHHQPIVDADSDTTRLCDLLHVADNIAHTLDLSGQQDEMVPPLLMDSWERLNLRERDCMRIFRETETQHEALCHALLN